MLFDLLLRSRTRKPVDVRHAEAILKRAREKIAATKAHTERCRSAHASAILDVHEGASEIVQTKARRALDLAVHEAADAMVELEAAEAIHRSSAFAARVDEHKRRVAEVSLHLGARDAAAKAFSEAQTVACASYRDMIESASKAKAALESVGPPAGSLLERGEIKFHVERELARLGGDPGLAGNRSFPGASTHDLWLYHNPGALPPLADVLTQASEHVIAWLRTRAPKE